MKEGLSRLRQLNHNKVQTTQISISDEISHPIQTQSHDQHQHQHGQQCSHGNSHSHSKNRKSGQVNYGIIVYTIFTMYSCISLEKNYFKTYLPNQHTYRDLMMYLSYFDVMMCLISYIVTIRTINKFPKMKSIPPWLKSTSTYDKAYSIDKVCANCQYYKMPRISHCSSCGYCIAKLDHHCIWSQNCIGYMNHKPFYLFTFFMMIGVIIYWYFSFYTYIALYGTCKFFSIFSWGVYIWWLVTSLSASVVGMMITGLCISHSFMLLSNFSTLDGLKKRKMCNLPICEWREYFLNDENINVYDRGQIQNYKQLFGKSILSFLYPKGRPLLNQFIIEKMNPYPTKLELIRFSGEIYEETQRQNQLRKIITNLKQSYLGKQFKIRNQIISLE